ncbi:MAG: hypothetical protein IKR04_04295 [Clostridia bacterium]|nr:hypothetical protein [Clostridia bacterium]
MQNVDGIIKFAHTERWAKKKAKRFICHNGWALNARDIKMTSAKKVYVPFYKYIIESKANSFYEKMLNGGKNGPVPAYYEADTESKFSLMLCANHKDIDINQFKVIAPFTDKSYKPMIDYSNYSDCEFLDFVDNDGVVECSSVADSIYTSSIELSEKEKAHRKGDKAILDSIQKIVFTSNQLSGDGRSYKSRIDYEVTETNRYYYPVWIVTAEQNGKPYTYYINDVNGNVSGANLKVKDATFFLIALGLILAPVILILSMFVARFNLDLSKYLIIVCMTVFLVCFLLIMLTAFPSLLGSINSNGELFCVIDKKVNSIKGIGSKNKFEQKISEYFDNN